MNQFNTSSSSKKEFYISLFSYLLAGMLQFGTAYGIVMLIVTTFALSNSLITAMIYISIALASGPFFNSIGRYIERSLSRFFANKPAVDKAADTVQAA